MEWKRNCPKCGEEISYIRIYDRDLAEKRNRKCHSCAMRSEETRKRISENHSHYWSGKKCSEDVKKKVSENHSHYWAGKKQSEESNRKRRLTAIKNIEKNKFNGGQMVPGYNPIGCEIIHWFNMYYDFNFRHAENGGEVCVDGYWPDGLDEKRKTIIEIDEPRHFNPDGTYKQKDIQRQKYLEGLGYKFIRIKIKHN